MKEARPANVVTTKDDAREPAVAPAIKTVAATTHSPENLGELADLQNAEQVIKDAVANAGSAEVVCVIRSIDNPRSASRVVVINRASPKFVNYLTDEVQAQKTVKSTTLRTALVDTPPRSTSRPYRRSRALSW